MRMGVSFERSGIMSRGRMSAKSFFLPGSVAGISVVLSLALSVFADHISASVTNIPFNLLSLTA